MTRRSPAGEGIDASRLAPFAVAIGGIVAGGVAHLLGRPTLAGWLWMATTATVLVPLTVSVARALRRRDLGVDLIALAAMSAALALGQHLAGAVIALMMAGGQALETWAGHRARRDLADLLRRAPSLARRWDGMVYSTVPIDEVRIGDRLLVRAGDVLPVDGVLHTAAQLDESALTGEPMPVEHPPGARVRSGTVNAGGAFELRAAASAADSTYARVLRLVEEAQRAKAPFVRMADRYARWFLPLTACVSAGAWWFSGDPQRALAVLVIATPCPLILAAPAAFVAGLSNAARRGIIVKGGQALEAMARSRVMLIDKTGTVTAGQASVCEIVAFGEQDEATILRLAASLDQVSPHVLAAALVEAAQRRALPLVFPRAVVELPGRGIAGEIDGRQVALGGLRWMAERGIAVSEDSTRRHRQAARFGGASILVAIDGRLAGLVRLEDHLRDDAVDTLAALRRAGIRRIVLVTGDDAEAAGEVGRQLGVDAVLSDHTPEDKVVAVGRERRAGPVIMVGDGLNDAPALAAADVGVAMAPRGAAAPAEAADVVLTVDRLDRLVDAFEIARRSRQRAVESVTVGMALSFAGMIAAAAGYLTPLAGAFLQEGIDVAVLLNSLRALLPARPGNVATPYRREAHGAEHTVLTSSLPHGGRP